MGRNSKKSTKGTLSGCGSLSCEWQLWYGEKINMELPVNGIKNIEENWKLVIKIYLLDVLKVKLIYP